VASEQAEKIADQRQVGNMTFALVAIDGNAVKEKKWPNIGNS